MIFTSLSTSFRSRQKINRSGYQRKSGTDHRINTIVVLSGEEESEPNQEQVKSLALKVRWVGAPNIFKIMSNTWYVQTRWTLRCHFFLFIWHSWKAIHIPTYMIIELNIRNNVVGWKETETTGLQFDGWVENLLQRSHNLSISARGEQWTSRNSRLS